MSGLMRRYYCSNITDVLEKSTPSNPMADDHTEKLSTSGRALD